jgi:hypothetical protein
MDVIRTPTHDVGMRERFGIPKRYVAPKTFNVKTLNVKRLCRGLFPLEDAVPLSLEYDLRTWKRYEEVWR